jgi:hypothetical protein
MRRVCWLGALSLLVGVLAMATLGRLEPGVLMGVAVAGCLAVLAALVSTQGTYHGCETPSQATVGERWRCPVCRTRWRCVDTLIVGHATPATARLAIWDRLARGRS